MKYVAFLCRISKRYKLHKICKALEIRPYPWQKLYALGYDVQFPRGRCTGKTMAVMLRLLMEPEESPFDHCTILYDDPDWDRSDRHRVRWYKGEYMRLAACCRMKGVPVVKTPLIYRMETRDFAPLW